MIEEMMESASQTGENQCRDVAIRDQDKNSKVSAISNITVLAKNVRKYLKIQLTWRNISVLHM